MTSPVLVGVSSSGAFFFTTKPRFVRVSTPILAVMLKRKTPQPNAASHCCQPDLRQRKKRGNTCAPAASHRLAPAIQIHAFGGSHVEAVSNHFSSGSSTCVTVRANFKSCV